MRSLLLATILCIHLAAQTGLSRLLGRMVAPEMAAIAGAPRILATASRPPDSKQPPGSGPGSSALHLVKRIHIGALVGDGPERTQLVRRNLQTELQMAGFEIVDQPSAADAVLSAKIEVWIVVDGDERDQRDSRYLFELTLSTTGAVLRKAKVLAGSGQWLENEARDVARQASRKLSAAAIRAACSPAFSITVFLRGDLFPYLGGHPGF